MTRSFLTTCLLLTLAAQAQAQAPPNVQITLDDGTTLIGKINQNIEVQTKFGKLTIPAHDIQHASLGYNLTDDETKAVTKAFKDLASANFKERHSAQAYLERIGSRALPLLPKLYGGTMPPAEIDPKDPALEAQQRIQMWNKTTSPDAKYLHDYFSTDDSNIKGKILNKQLTIQHNILGDLKVDVAHIKSIHAHSNKELTLLPDQDWQEICVLYNGKLILTAHGTVELWPQQPGQYLANPKGFNTTGKGGQFMAGAVIAKIDEGQPFFVGDSYTFTHTQGKLFLRIVENPWNSKSDGKYTVKVERR